MAASATARARPGRLPLWVWPAAGLLVALALLVGYDQSLWLTSAHSTLATANSYAHEFFHDGRHLLGFPCH